MNGLRLLQKTKRDLQPFLSGMSGEACADFSKTSAQTGYAGFQQEMARGIDTTAAGGDAALPVGQKG